MWSISEVKRKGREAFKANYWKCVLAAVVMALLLGDLLPSFNFNSDGTASSSFENLSPTLSMVVLIILLFIAIVAVLVSIFVLNPIVYSCMSFFKENTETEGQANFSIGEGFSNYMPVVKTLFLANLYCFLWSLLFIIPGIIKTYAYRMSPYILMDNPDLSASEVLERSQEMMRGHKWRSFLFDLSFIGWNLLGLLTCGILNIFWTNPYKYSADSALYLELRNRSEYF